MEKTSVIEGTEHEKAFDIGKLRDQKTELGEEKYYALLEPLLVELARVYQPTK